MNHYTYRLTTQSSCGCDLYYIGVRSSRCNPEQDVGYMGSSRLVDYMLLQGIKFQKQIIDTYSSRELAETHEQLLFDQLECIDDMTCINLNSFNRPYTPGRAGDKMMLYKDLFPQLRPGFFVDKFRLLDPSDMSYRVKTSGLYWLFINHPDNLKYYWHTTGTRSYWPGRSDNLMTDSNGVRKYYLTRLDLVSGTPTERIQQLLSHHYISGQQTVVLEVIEQLILLVNPDTLDYNICIDQLKKCVQPEQQWMLNRINKAKKK
jgi:hypothetical protein